MNSTQPSEPGTHTEQAVGKVSISPDISFYSKITLEGISTNHSSRRNQVQTQSKQLGKPLGVAVPDAHALHGASVGKVELALQGGRGLEWYSACHGQV